MYGSCTDYLTNLIEGPKSWPRLNEFLKISKLEQDKDNYLEKIKQFD